MNNSTETHFSLFLSSLGWILLVVGALGFFLWAKPMYYQQGAQDQYATDLAIIDERLGVDETAIEGVPGIIKRLADGRLILTSSLQPQNPLRSAYPTERTILFSEETTLLSRTLLTEEEYNARLAEERTDDSQEVLPFDESVVTSEALEEGMTILVLPFESEGLNMATEITAHQIIIDSTPVPVPDVNPVPQLNIE